MRELRTCKRRFFGVNYKHGDEGYIPEDWESRRLMGYKAPANFKIWEGNQWIRNLRIPRI